MQNPNRVGVPQQDLDADMIEEVLMALHVATQVGSV